jgi:hypothetical protein
MISEVERDESAALTVTSMQGKVLVIHDHVLRQ